MKIMLKKKLTVVKTNNVGIIKREILSCEGCMCEISICDNCGKKFTEKDKVNCRKSLIHYCEKCNKEDI